MASPTPLRTSPVGRMVLVVAASSLFACAVGSGAGDPSRVDVLVLDRIDSAAPARHPEVCAAGPGPAFVAFTNAITTDRFPFHLTVLPADPTQPLAAAGPGRCTVTPGRASSTRQSVPPRTRRKLRTWERDAAV